MAALASEPSETFTPEDGSVENISFGDILSGLKSDPQGSLKNPIDL